MGAARNDVSRVLALKTIEKLGGEEQLAAVASMLLPPQSRAYYRKAGMSAASIAASTTGK